MLAYDQVDEQGCTEYNLQFEMDQVALLDVNP